MKRNMSSLINTLKPDLILLNGNVITVDERFSVAQSVAIKGDRIVAVGTNSDSSSPIRKAGSPFCKRGSAGYECPIHPIPVEER